MTPDSPHAVCLNETPNWNTVFIAALVYSQAVLGERGRGRPSQL